VKKIPNSEQSVYNLVSPTLYQFVNGSFHIFYDNKLRSMYYNTVSIFMYRLDIFQTAPK